MTAAVDPCTPLNDARAALLKAALRAFAEHGINGVSLRTVTALAGQLNQSAIRYHFGGKDGLVQAVLDDVMARLAPHQQASLAQLAEHPPGQPWTARALTELICQPFLMLFMSGPDGLNRIRFLSRLTWQEGGKGQALLVAAVQPYFLRFSPALLTLAPDQPEEAMALKMYLAVNTLIHGLADVTLLGAHPVFGLDSLRATRPDHMLDYFYRYIAGGLQG